MVGAFGEVQVMDWGLAKVLAGPASGADPGGDPEVTFAVTRVETQRDSEDLLTQAGTVLGTPAYMAPEQAVGALHEVDRRSDVFGLGGILAAVLTGKPPFVGDSAEVTRVKAARGQLGDCFARLDGCGVDPELVALAKWCLAPTREDRPADAGEVATVVAAMRAAAEERARQAELDRVKAEGEVAAAAAASVERRKRRRVWLGAAAGLVVAVVGGLGAVLNVQRQANTDLAAKNAALEAEQAKVEQRFEMARKAIAAFHTTIDEQPELGNEAFKPLRKKLLESAAGFYRELEGLLANESDAKSRSALADGYFQLAELTEKIGNKSEALVLYRRALVLRRELATRPEADVATRLAVSETLRKAGLLAASTGDAVAARRAIEEAREVAAALETEAPTDAVRRALATSHHAMGWLLTETGKSADALDNYANSRDILERLADARPDSASCQRDLAGSHNNIGLALYRTGKPAEALASCEAARGILQRLVDAHPDVVQYQRELSWSHNMIGILHRQANRPVDALSSHEAARNTRQRLADAYPAVDQYQSELAGSYQNIATLLLQTSKPAEAFASYEAARGIQQRLAEAHPAVTTYQANLVTTLLRIGDLHRQMGRPAAALSSQEAARDIRKRLADAHPASTEYKSDLAASHHSIGIVLDGMGRSAEALVAFETSRDLYHMLADANPDVAEYQIHLASSHTSTGVTLDRAGRTAEALAAFGKALDMRKRLADAHPTVPSYRAELARAHNTLGRWLAKDGRFAEAFAALDAGMGINQKLVEASPKAVHYTNALGYSHAYRGWARGRAGEPRAAADDLRTAVDLWAKDPQPTAETRFETARALALLAKLGGVPASGVTSAEATAYADRSVAALADAINTGWAQPTELREPDFDSVRSREDFRKLQSRLRADVTGM